MKSIEERGDLYSGTNIHRKKDTPTLFLLSNAYVAGATDQREIDIQRACEYLSRYTCMFITPNGIFDENNFIEDFKQTMKGE